MSFYFLKRVTINLPKIVVAAMKVITQGLHDYFICPSPLFTWKLVVFLRRVKNDRY